MIYVDVIGCKSSKVKKELILATYNYLKQLNVYKKSRPLEIVITLTNSDADGFCDFNYDKEYPEVYIELNKNLSLQEMLVALAHEIVHAKQYVKNELRTKDGLNYWKGAIFSDKGFNTTLVPWEQEAYNKEQQLYQKYAK